MEPSSAFDIAAVLADAQRKELAELKNQAETLLYTTDAALDGYRDLVDATTLEETKTQAIALRALMAANGDVATIRSAYQKLEAMTFAIAEAMYATPDAGSGEKPAS